MLIRRAGYMRLDNRLSGGTLQEFDLKTCIYCHAQVKLNPSRTRERTYSRKYGGYVCDGPVCQMNNANGNDPLNKIIADLQELTAKQTTE